MRARSTLFTLYSELVFPQDTVWVGRLVEWMELLGFSEPAVRAAVSRSAARGWILPQRRGRYAYYKLSPRVFWQVQQVRRRLGDKACRQWDGRWRLLVYAVPEGMRSQRDKFRNELVMLGYGTPAPGIWLSPCAEQQATRELISFYQLEPYVELFSAERVGDEPPQRLVNKAFKLAEAKVRYRQLQRRIGSLPANPSAEEAFAQLIQLIHEARKILFFDPGLPPQLAPPGFDGAATLSRFSEARERLRLAAGKLVNASS